MGLSWQPHFWVLAFAMSAALCALILWLLERRSRERLWYPILRVLPDPMRLLPKLQWVPPPWISFIFFLLSAILVILFCMRPALDVLVKSSDRDQERVHILVDLSPSMQGVVKIQELRDLVIQTMDSIPASSRLSVATTRSPEVFEVLDKNFDRSAFANDLNFHRYGAKLEQVIAAQTAQLGRLQKLIILSDGDEHSWAGVNLEFLQNGSSVYLLSPTQIDPSSKSNQNIWIDAIDSSLKKSEERLEIEARVKRNVAGTEASGLLQISLSAQKSVAIPWRMDVQQKSQVLTGQIDTEGLAEDVLLARLVTDGEDAMELDDEFRAGLSSNQGKAIVVAGAMSEANLRSSTYAFEQTLAVLDIPLTRLDALPQTISKKAQDNPLWFIWSQGVEDLSEFCPLHLLKLKNMQADPLEKRSLVWIIPTELTIDLGPLCRCAALLSGARSDEAKARSICPNDMTQKDLTDTVLSIGAKGVGTSISAPEEGMVFQFPTNPVAGLDVVVFSIPLKPIPGGSLSVSNLPLLLRDLLQVFAPNWFQHGKAQSWPRLDDATFYFQGSKHGLLQSVALSNVPFGESILKALDPSMLPDPYDFKSLAAAPQLESAERDRDEKSVIYDLCALLIVLIVGEALILGLRRAFARRKPSTASAIMLLIACAYFNVEQKSVAQVNVETIGYETLDLSNLSKEVELRTSIDLTRSSVANSIKPKEGWIWIASPALAEQKKRSQDFREFLMRGGFLIVENVRSTSELTSILKTWNLPLRSDKEISWQPIPLDHELMRSFHLLENLEGCRGFAWHGLTLDQRLAALTIPYSFLTSLASSAEQDACAKSIKREDRLRTFINILMVVLATDYKRDQIHLPEILKRLR